MPSLLNNYQKYLLLLTCIAALSSCYSSTSQEINKNFLKEYGKNVEQINQQRESANQSSNQDQQKIPSCLDARFNCNPSINTQGDNIFPNSQTLQEGSIKQLPDDMFKINYQSQNYPDSYATNKISFDDIDIPQTDSFGIETALGDKNYQLINHYDLQKNLDLSSSISNKTEREISLELIKQEKRAKQNTFKFDISNKSTNSLKNITKDPPSPAQNQSEIKP